MTADEAAKKPENPDREIITELLWETLYSAEIRCGGQFEGLTEHVVKNWKAWRVWQQDDDPYALACPGDFEENMSTFDKLVLIKVFRNEFIQRSMSVYIIEEMDKFYVEPPSVQMEVIYDDLAVYTPLIFVLS